MASTIFHLIEMFYFTFAYMISALSALGPIWRGSNVSPGSAETSSLAIQIRDSNSYNTSIRPLERQRALDEAGFAQMNLPAERRKFEDLKAGDTLFGLGCDGPVRRRKRTRDDARCS